MRASVTTKRERERSWGFNLGRVHEFTCSPSQPSLSSSCTAVSKTPGRSHVLFSNHGVLMLPVGTIVIPIPFSSASSLAPSSTAFDLPGHRWVVTKLPLLASTCQQPQQGKIPVTAWRCALTHAVEFKPSTDRRTPPFGVNQLTCLRGVAVLGVPAAVREAARTTCICRSRKSVAGTPRDHGAITSLLLVKLLIFQIIASTT